MRRGFTLVEIMIVVAILLVLATLAVGGLSHCYDNAARKRCISNLRVVHAAREAFFFQNPGQTQCPPMDGLAQGGYFRGKTENSSQPKCPSGGTYSYQSELSNLQTVPSCSQSDLGHVLTLYE